ncbi:MAG: DUF1624 domain-containing protein [Gemmatimonadaceae bacterium]
MTTAAANVPLTAPAVVSAEPRGRIASIDLVRGAIMVLMALDHVRDFVTELRFPPENLAQGSTALFFTRWFTHFCAPGFFLLAGLGIGLALHKRRSPVAMTTYLLTRGVWLLVLELIITPVGWRFGFNFFPAFALVLWALGWSMILMAVLVHLPRAVVTAVALIMIGGHNLLDGIQPAALGSFAWLWHVLHVPGFVIPGKLLIAYPLIPWIGVMALGFVLADAYRWDAARRRRFFIWCGAAAVALFIALRFANAYGNPDPWTAQRTPGLTVSSFLNVRKYPPSLHFLLMTLGPVLIALALTERVRGRVGSWLSVYGRVPLFFYVTHIFVAHAVGVLLALAQGGELRRIPVITDPGALPEWFGVELPGVYLAWMLVVVALYFPCRAFARLKERRRDWWLQYL